MTSPIQIDPDLVLREATNEDSTNVKELVISVLEEYGLQHDLSNTDADLFNIFNSYQKEGGYFCVIEKQGKILGSGGIFYLTASKCELRKMYLVPAIRGKGLGKFLLEHLLFKAKLLGFTYVSLETASVLKEAISLYKRYGFTEVTAKHLSCRCDQAYELSLSSISESPAS
jgi:putative acetyltransferase